MSGHLKAVENEALKKFRCSKMRFSYFVPIKKKTSNESLKSIPQLVVLKFNNI